MDNGLGALNFADNLEGLLKVISSKNLRNIYGNKIFQKNYLMSNTLQGVKNDTYQSQKFQQNSKVLGKYLSEMLNEAPITQSNIKKILGSIKTMSRSNLDSIQNGKVKKAYNKEERICMKRNSDKGGKIIQSSIEANNVEDLTNKSINNLNYKFYTQKKPDVDENPIFLTAINSLKNKRINTDIYYGNNLTTKAVKIKNISMGNNTLESNLNLEKNKNNIDQNPNELLKIKKNYENLCIDISKTNSKFKKCDHKIEQIKSNLKHIEKIFLKQDQKNANFQKRLSSRKSISNIQKRNKNKIFDPKQRNNSGNKKYSRNQIIDNIETEDFIYDQLSFNSYCDKKLKIFKNNECQRKNDKSSKQHLLRLTSKIEKVDQLIIPRSVHTARIQIEEKKQNIFKNEESTKRDEIKNKELYQTHLKINQKAEEIKIHKNKSTIVSSRSLQELVKKNKRTRFTAKRNSIYTMNSKSSLNVEIDFRKNNFDSNDCYFISQPFFNIDNKIINNSSRRFSVLGVGINQRTSIIKDANTGSWIHNNSETKQKLIKGLSLRKLDIQEAKKHLKLEMNIKDIPTFKKEDFFIIKKIKND